MFPLLVVVPALLVVVLGYVVGHALCTWLGGMADAAFGTSLAAAAEPAGWITGLLGLAVVVRRLVVRYRRSRGVEE